MSPPDDGLTVEGSALGGGVRAKISGLRYAALIDLMIVSMLALLTFMVYTGETERAAFRKDVYRLMAESEKVSTLIIANQSVFGPLRPALNPPGHYLYRWR